MFGNKKFVTFNTVKNFNPFLDALIAPDFTDRSHLDIPVKEMVREFANQFHSRHADIWERVWEHNLGVLRFEIGKKPAAFFRNEIELQFMRMVRSMSLLNPLHNARKERLLYDGPDDRKCRPFCAERVGKAYTRGQILAWNRFDWDGKITAEYGATDEDIFINLGGFGCRHYFSFASDEPIETK